MSSVFDPALGLRTARQYRLVMFNLYRNAEAEDRRKYR